LARYSTGGAQGFVAERLVARSTASEIFAMMRSRMGRCRMASLRVSFRMTSRYDGRTPAGNRVDSLRLPDYRSNPAVLCFTASTSKILASLSWAGLSLLWPPTLALPDIGDSPRPSFPLKSFGFYQQTQRIMRRAVSPQNSLVLWIRCTRPPCNPRSPRGTFSSGHPGSVLPSPPGRPRIHLP